MPKFAKLPLKQFLPVSIRVMHIDPVTLSQCRTGFVLVHEKTEMWWNWATRERIPINIETRTNNGGLIPTANGLWVLEFSVTINPPIRFDVIKQHRLKQRHYITEEPILVARLWIHTCISMSCWDSLSGGSDHCMTTAYTAYSQLP